MRIIILALLVCGAAFGQCGASGTLIFNPISGLMDCTGSSSGSGTVTSVGLAGTANQITVTGATPITTSGSWTLSIPTNPTLPGNTTGTFIGNITGNVTGNASGTAGSLPTTSLLGGVTLSGLTGPIYMTAGVPRIATGTCNSSNAVFGDGTCAAISTAFSILTSATNSQAAMVVGTGASLATSGTGTIAATTVTGFSPAASKVLTLSGSMTQTVTDGSTVAFGTGGTVLYNTSMIAAIVGNADSQSIANGATNYLAPGTGAPSTIARREYFAPASGVARNLYMRTNATQPATGSLDCALTIGGVAQALAVSFPANQTATTISDTTHTVAISQGNVLGIACTNNASTGAAALNAWGFAITAN